MIKKIKGAIYGFALGDAIGVSYEGYDHIDLKKSYIDIIPPLNFKKAYPKIMNGTWSDDTAQMIMLLHSLIEKDCLDLYDFKDKLIDWHDNGAYALDSNVFDIGNQTHRAILELKNGVSPEFSGYIETNGQGNGSLMRVLPIALYFNDSSDLELVKYSHKQSLITHGHIVNQICCALYTLWLRRVLEENNPSESFIMAAKKLESIYKNNHMQNHLNFFINEVKPFHKFFITGYGHVIDTIHSVKYALQNSIDYEGSIINAIQIGQDTDTIAALTGGIAGAYYEYQNIDEKWKKYLRGTVLLDHLINQLIERYKR